MEISTRQCYRAHFKQHKKIFFEDAGIDVLDSPSRSPDLNPIKNFWCILVATFFKYFRQFEDTERLLEAIGLAWDSTDVDLHKKLARSMPRRCTEVIEKNSDRGHY